MAETELIKYLETEGYFNIREISGRGICGLRHFIFTTGLCYGLDEYAYKGRFCFDDMTEAKEALNNWDGIGDPQANWIKHKGKIEYPNPLYDKND